ncbi:MAG: choice-of-anchor D domain-containing protein [Myxococcota bacterium]
MRTRTRALLPTLLVPSLLLLLASGCDSAGGGPGLSFGDSGGSDTVLDGGSTPGDDTSEPADDAGPDSTGPDSTGPDSTGPDGTGPDSTGPDGTGPDGTGPDAVEDDVPCVPDCDGRECGGDGCGGSCGGCPSAAPFCKQGLCQVACTPTCDGRECGGDGCGGSCGTCPSAAPLCEDHLCKTGVPPGEPGLAVAPAEVDLGAVASGETSEKTVTLLSVGEAPVSVTGFSLAGDAGFSITLGGQTWTTSGAAAQEVALDAPLVVAPGTSQAVTVAFQAEEAGEALATLSFVSDSAGAATTEVTLVGEGEAPPQVDTPDIEVSPATVDFGNVPLGESKTRTVDVVNAGDADLEVTGFLLSGNPAFAFLHDGQAWPVSPETASQGITFDEPLVVAPGTSEEVSVRFTPEDLNGAQGQLVLRSNDPDEANALVNLSGNESGPCISVQPKKVDFGGKLVGEPATVDVEVTSCGEEPLQIQGLALSDESSGAFSLDLGSLPGVGDGVGAIVEGQDTPVELDVNQSATFQVIFVPDEINALDEGGQPIPDLGEIRIVSDAIQSEVDVEVRGFGVEVDCPTAVIVVEEGEEVIPQTKLHLVGSQSYAVSGDVAQYEWSVQQPVGSQSVFLPSASAPDPTFEANVAGTYVFELRVWDDNGEESCVSAQYTVFVNPDEAIHVELLWDTPLDPDQTDEGPEAGADMDLHFLHPFATGEDVDGDGEPDGWFDQPFDCFWFNAQPNWGSLDPAVDDDPGLDRDDTDGAGPENVNLNIPEDGLTYKVGVQYWNDHGFGPSNATVRVYIYSEKVFELKNVELEEDDLWEVATIDWPSGDVNLITEDGGEFRIIPDYQHPFFPSE